MERCCYHCTLEGPRSLFQNTRETEKVIQGLGLGKVGDNVVGTVLKRGLSGGEKRRTTVGQELVVKQALALLDEPTSGLDGTAAYDVIKVCRTVVQRQLGGRNPLRHVARRSIRLPPICIPPAQQRFLTPWFTSVQA